VPQFFNLPKSKAVFPLHQGEGRHSLDYVAEIDFPPQQSSTACKLDLRYTYGADEPYSLDFMPCERSSSLPRVIHAKWSRADQVAVSAPTSYSPPPFPEMKSWSELRSYQKKDGPRDLVDQVEQVLTRIDPVEAAQREAARKEANRKKRFHEKEEQYRRRRKSGIVSSPVMQKNGPKFFFIEGDGGKFYCNENALRRGCSLDRIVRGTPVWFTIRNFEDKKTGEQKSCANDVALEDVLPDDLQSEFASLSTPIQPVVLPIGEFLNRNAESINKALRSVRFPMLTIMRGARSLSDPSFPEALRNRLQKVIDILCEALDSGNIPERIRMEVFQFFSYLHKFAPASFFKWANAEIGDSDFIGASWRKIAYCLGDVSCEWQHSVLEGILARILRMRGKNDVDLAIGALSIASWRSERFLDSVPPAEADKILCILRDRMRQGQAEFLRELSRVERLAPKDNEPEVEFGRRKKLRDHLAKERICLFFELLLAFLRVRPGTSECYAAAISPGTRHSADFVDLIDSWTGFLHRRKISLPFRVCVENVEKPAELYNTPDILYVLRSCLTGDDGANAISIGISESEGEED